MSVRRIVFLFHPRAFQLEWYSQHQKDSPVGERSLDEVNTPKHLSRGQRHGNCIESDTVGGYVGESGPGLLRKRDRDVDHIRQQGPRVRKPPRIADLAPCRLSHREVYEREGDLCSSNQGHNQFEAQLMGEVGNDAEQHRTNEIRANKRHRENNEYGHERPRQQ